MADTLARRGAGGRGNTDRQQSDSRASAEGKGQDVHGERAATASREIGRQTGREREGTVGEMGKQGALSSATPGVWLPASSSINNTQGNGEGGKEGMEGRKNRTQQKEMDSATDIELLQFREQQRKGGRQDEGKRKVDWQ